MASNLNFVDFVVDQIDYPGEIRYRLMFGEYTIYVDDKILGLVCDNKLFVRPTEGGRAFIKEEVVEAAPYPGAKLCFLIEDKIEDRKWLSELVAISVKELPLPKPKKKKRINKNG